MQTKLTSTGARGMTMGFLDTLRELDGGGNETLYECRECETTVSPDTAECPTCDSTEIARYRV